MRNLILAASLAANAALAGALLASRLVEGDGIAYTMPHPAIETAVSGDDAGRMQGGSTAAGIDAPSLTTAAHPAVPRAGEDAAVNERAYWQRLPDEPLAQVRAQLDAQDRARQRILELYGPGAKRDAALSPLFRPLGPGFEFLSSNEQVTVNRVRLEHRAAQAAAAHAAMRLDNSRDDGARVAAYDYESLRTALSAVLDPEMLFEYELRAAPLAALIATSGIELGEHEFRASFRQLRRLSDPGLSTSHYLEIRRDLRNLIGSARLNRLWAAQDPRFMAIRRAAAAHSLREDTIYGAYSIIADAQDALLQELSADGRRADTENRMLRDALAERDRRLAGLVGEHAARDLLGALEALSRTAPGIARGQL